MADALARGGAANRGRGRARGGGVNGGVAINGGGGVNGGGVNGGVVVGGRGRGRGGVNAAAQNNRGRGVINAAAQRDILGGAGNRVQQEQGKAFIFFIFDARVICEKWLTAQVKNFITLT